VVKDTSLEELRKRYPSRDQIRYIIESRGETFGKYEQEDKMDRHARACMSDALPRDVPHVTINRDDVSRFMFRKNDFIVACGPDGLFVNVARYLEGQPVIGINPESSRERVLMQWDGRDDRRYLRQTIADLVCGKADSRACARPISLGKATTNDGQEVYAVNDFMIGRINHVSPRYHIDYGGISQRQMSSGILVSTGVGSSGWIHSIVRAAEDMTGGEFPLEVPFEWDAERLMFIVREPITRGRDAMVTFGEITPDKPLTVTSEMAEGGVIFSDGVLEDSIDFRAGITATITVAERKAYLICP